MVNIVQFTQSEPHSIINTLLLFGFLALATSCALPRQIAALVAGINLGAVMGAIVATLAVTVGCWLTFSVSRYLLAARVRARYPDKINSLSDFIAEKTFLKVIVIRLLPIGSNFLTNIVAGVSKVSMKAYVSGSLVGFIPQMVIFSLAGSGIRLGAKTELIASGVLFVIALLLTAYLVKVRKKNSKNATSVN
ncbi:VTT domain-containing protein [Colwellia asteriadis]|uniref:TVP38/TMEM64 family membrane protein n=1 Tax=Colwellia asteriadis TaxID=517723 RepID=A0ABN1L462_9GAMM|nr:VTT domain-containing protein [Colwellia sp. D2M02]